MNTTNKHRTENSPDKQKATENDSGHEIRVCDDSFSFDEFSSSLDNEDINGGHTNREMNSIQNDNIIDKSTQIFTKIKTSRNSRFL